jgi:GDP-L-galactose phosphorylase
MEMKLTIKRVPTIVSNYQEDAAAAAGERPRGGCGRNCLGDCCLPGESPWI